MEIVKCSEYEKKTDLTYSDLEVGDVFKFHNKDSAICMRTDEGYVSLSLAKTVLSSMSPGKTGTATMSCIVTRVKAKLAIEEK